MTSNLTEFLLVGTFLVLIVTAWKAVKLSRERDEIYNRHEGLKAIINEADRYLSGFPGIPLVTEYLMKHAGMMQGRVNFITGVRQEVQEQLKLWVDRQMERQNGYQPIITTPPFGMGLTAGMVNQAHNLYAEGMDYDLFMVTVLSAYMAGMTVEVEHLSGEPRTALGEASGHVLLSKLVVGDQVVFQRGEEDGTAEQ